MSTSEQRPVVCWLDRSEDGIVHAGSGVDGSVFLLESIQLMLLSLRNSGLQCLLTDLPDEWMRLEVVEEELGQIRSSVTVPVALMRLTVVGGGGCGDGATQGEALESLAYLFA
ncbi:hypothetical protein Tco_0871611 [Tanacetum coccineum]